MYLYRAIDSTGDTVDFWNHEYRLLAERKGFEPSRPFNGSTPLAGERLRPLGHLSEDAD
jgi:hypothetical protein